ncbi:MAG: hypothetical protein QOK39_641 [Acidimicrobiaceae bacterium]|nr:hypothetical protein [Acidimicrobiaceae bacterium]
MTMTEATNQARARWAATAIAAFANETGTTGEDLATQVGDLLADLHHLCDAGGISFRVCSQRADDHYRAEIDEGAAEVSSPDEMPAALTVPVELALVAAEYSALLNTVGLPDVDRLIADACVDPLWDDRTNLLSLLADAPEELGLVLATGADTYIVVRYAAGTWVADSAPVDWDALEDRAFGPDGQDEP